MNYAKIKPVDIANGEGVRVSLFVSGCSHHCKGCFNQELWDYNAGQEFTYNTVYEILDACSKPYITGLSLLGGEPLDPKNGATMIGLCYSFKHYHPDKDIWCYTGYDWDDIKHLYILNYIDVLVDGRFIEELADPRLKFRGSSNQRIIDVPKSLKAGKVILKEGFM